MVSARSGRHLGGSLQQHKSFSFMVSHLKALSRCKAYHSRLCRIFLSLTRTMSLGTSKDKIANTNFLSMQSPMKAIASFSFSVFSVASICLSHKGLHTWHRGILGIELYHPFLNLRVLFWRQQLAGSIHRLRMPTLA